jgi:hypothetical protein
MKITFVNRKPRPYGNFSIESYFKVIESELNKKAEVIQWNAPFFSKGILPRFFSVLSLLSIKKSDIYHVTGDTNFFILGLNKGKKVITFHDIGFASENRGLKQFILKKNLD